MSSVVVCFLYRPLKDKILTRVGQRRWRTHLAEEKNRKEVDASFLLPESSQGRPRAPKKRRRNALDHEDDFEPRSPVRGYEGMRTATQTRDSESESEEDHLLHQDGDVEIKQEEDDPAALDSWKKFEPETRTLRRLAEFSIKSDVPGSLSGSAPKKFSFVTAKFVVSHLLKIIFRCQTRSHIIIIEQKYS